MFLPPNRATIKRATLALALVCISTIKASGFDRWDFGVHGSWSSINVSNELKEVYPKGFGAGMDIGMVLSEYFALRFAADHISSPADLDEYQRVFERLENSLGPPIPVLVKGGHIGTLTFLFGAKLKLIHEPVAPFLSSSAGLGYVFHSGVSRQLVSPFVQYATATISDAHSKAGLCASLGGGIDVDLLPIKFTVEASYRSIFVDGEALTGAVIQLGVLL